MSGETLASKLNKKLVEYGHTLATVQVGEIMSIIDSHYRVVRDQSSTEELEVVTRDRDHLAEIVKAFEEVIEDQNTRLRALKESVNIVSTPRGFESLFRPLPAEEQRQKSLVKTAEWVLGGDPKLRFKNEAQAEYDSNPELRDTLDRASKSPTVKRTYAPRRNKI